MKTKLLPSLALAALLFSTNTNAQSNHAFAVTSETKGTFNWNVVREIDLSTGEVVKTYYDQSLHKNFQIVNSGQDKILPASPGAASSISISAGAPLTLINGVQGNLDKINPNDIESISILKGASASAIYGAGGASGVMLVTTKKIKSGNSYDLMPMGQGVAAAAYDAKHNRLYYTTMRGTDLRYFDLNSSTGKIVYNQNQPLFDGNRYDEANVITRMSFASDGNGYAITNDGKNLIRFTTDQKPVITNLGELIDGKKNGSIGVHNQCSSWGGDMVGDAYGNLYMITMRNHIFKINPQTRIADYIGQVKGLPAEFTSNGMVVDADGEVVLSSAAVSDGYYRVNISTLQAVAVQKTSDKVYNSSDLANSNLLYQSTRTDNKFMSEVLGNKFVSIYPNPVVNKIFNVQFDRVAAGRYNLVLTDASGRDVLAKTLQINSKGQMERVSLPKAAAGGMYFIKLTGADGKLVYSDKIIVE